jgi:hypothetical protein
MHFKASFIFDLYFKSFLQKKMDDFDAEKRQQCVNNSLLLSMITCLETKPVGVRPFLRKKEEVRSKLYKTNDTKRYRKPGLRQFEIFRY